MIGAMVVAALSTSATTIHVDAQHTGCTCCPAVRPAARAYREPDPVDYYDWKRIERNELEQWMRDGWVRRPVIGLPRAGSPRFNAALRRAALVTRHRSRQVRLYVGRAA